MGQLHDRTAEDLVLRNLSPATRRHYLLYWRKFAAFCRRVATQPGLSAAKMRFSESRGLLSGLWLQQNNRPVNEKRDFERAGAEIGLTTWLVSHYRRNDVSC
jgi:hypothetical protein